MRHLPAPAAFVVAPLGALLVWTLAVPVLGITLAVPGGTVGPAAVAVTAAVVPLAAWPVRAAFARRASRAKVDPCAAPTGWWLTCAAALLVSLLGPLGAASAPAICALSAMHTVVGAVVVAMLDPRPTSTRDEPVLTDRIDKARTDA